ncbi:MAG: hypothetical protein RIC55_14340 [Pirellulaceae bacterium]
MFSFATKFLPCESGFHLARQAGFPAAEFWLDGTLVADWRRIAEIALRFPFRYALHFPNKGEFQADDLRDSADLYHAIDSSALVMHPPMYERYGAALLRIDPSLRLAIENGILNPQQLPQWAETYPGLTLDVEHVWKYTLGDGPLEDLLSEVESILSNFGHKLYHVHLPGYQCDGQEQHPLYFNPELARAVLTLLADHGYQQLVVSEANQEFQTREHLRRDMDLFDAWHAARPTNARRNVRTAVR